jgi:hypothetical protein
MDLWLLPASSQLSHPGCDELAAICRRADALAPIAPGLDAALCAGFGWRRSPPWAALLSGVGADSSTPWLAADLIHVRAEVAGARVMALAADAAEPDPDLASLFAAVRPWLADEAIEMAQVEGGRALLRCPVNHGDPAVAGPDAVLGCDLREVLPVDLRWQRRLNETQIVLTQQSSNQARAARGLPPWNSLWFWGQGSADECPALPVRTIASSDPLLRALARHQGATCVDADARADAAVLRDLRDPRRLLGAWQSGLRPRDAQLRCVDGIGWRVRGWQRLRVWR